MGFTDVSDTPFREPCDSAIGNNPKNRLCFPTSSGYLVPGGRCGTIQNIYDDSYQRIFLHSLGPGVSTNVPLSALSGWTLCASSLFGEAGMQLQNIIDSCGNGLVMIGCGAFGSGYADVAAFTSAADVFFDVGDGRNASIISNGAKW
jgi:hypothetical protein